MLFPYLLKVSFLLAILTLSYRWFIQFETFSKFNRILLIFNVLSAWTLPCVPLSDWGPTEVQKKFHNTVPKVIQSWPVVSEKISSVQMTSVSIAEKQSQEWMLTDFIYTIYVLGVVFMAALFSYQILKLFLALRKMPSKKLDHGIILILDTKATIPYSFFKYIVCNPEKYSTFELQQILVHEMEHSRWLHSLDLLLADIQRILLWLNPFAWVHYRLVQGNLEYLADKAVIENGFEKKQYQLNLLKVTLQTNESPLINSFAQSLLKKRIKMMNRKRSNSSALAKYGLLILTLYLSSAFVAPYKEQIISLAPVVIKPVITAIAQPENNDKKILSAPTSLKIQKPKSNKVAAVDSLDLPENKRSKWVFEKNSTLYWAISPLATLETINEVRQEIKNFGGEMNINAIVYDPLQMYITTLTVDVKMKNSSGRGLQKKDHYTPMEGMSGYINKKGFLGMGLAPDEPLGNELKKDQDKVLFIQKENETKYFVEKLKEDLSDKNISSSSSTYPRKSLEGENAAKLQEVIGIGRSTRNTLVVTTINRHATDYFLNTKPISFEEINEIPLDQIDIITIVKDQIGRKYIIVNTK